MIVTLMVGISWKIKGLMFLGKAFLYPLNDSWWKESDVKVQPYNLSQNYLDQLGWFSSFL